MYSRNSSTNFPPDYFFSYHIAGWFGTAVIKRSCLKCEIEMESEIRPDERSVRYNQRKGQG